MKFFKLKEEELLQVQELQQKVVAMLESSAETTSIAALKQAVFESELSWLKWKASRCPNYEVTPLDNSVRAKLQARRQAKLESKQPQRQPLIQPKELNLHRGGKRIHQCLRAPL